MLDTHCQSGNMASQHINTSKQKAKINLANWGGYINCQ